jgi:hypothetical protein
MSRAALSRCLRGFLHGQASSFRLAAGLWKHRADWVEPNLLRVEITGDAISAVVTHPAFTSLAQSATEYFQSEPAAQNSVQLRMTDPVAGKRYEITIRKLEGKMPNEVVQDLRRLLRWALTQHDLDGRLSDECAEKIRRELREGGGR